MSFVRESVMVNGRPMTFETGRLAKQAHGSILITYGDSVVLVVANMDPKHRHAGWIDLDLDMLGVQSGESFQVHDVLSDSRHHWSSSRAYVELDPALFPASIFVVRRKVRSERDFEYFL